MEQRDTENEMSRPRKDGVDYFPHFVNWGKTIPILESRFGNDGYAFWFKLLESLGKSKTHSIDCNDAMEWEFLVSRARVDAEKAEAILALLGTLGAIDRALWENSRTIFAENFVANVAGVYDKRGVSVPEIPDSPGFCDRNNGASGVSVSESTHSIGKDTIGQESKGEGEAKRKRFTPPELSDCIAYGRAIGIPVAECEAFLDNKTSNGWKVGKSPMTDWKAAMRTWKRNMTKFAPSKQKPAYGSNDMKEID